MEGLLKVINPIAVIGSVVGIVYLLQEKFMAVPIKHDSHTWSIIGLRFSVALLAGAAIFSLMYPPTIATVFANLTLASTAFFSLKHF